MANFYEFRIEDLRSSICCYIYHLLSPKKKCLYVGDQSMGLGFDTHIFWLPYGISSFEFQSHKLSANHLLSDEIKGLSLRTTRHTELILHIASDTWEEAEQIFRDFLKAAKDFVRLKDDESVPIWMYDKRNGNWIHRSSLFKRKMNTVYLSKKIKDELITNLKQFYEEKDDYLKYGIPYKQVYLLHGHPGTGKTSMIFAAAALHNKSISILSLDREMTDSIFANAISRLNDSTVLLLEDIDSVVGREKTAQCGDSLITFSSLINFLDGVGRKEGLVVFITANSIDMMNDIFLRCGRIDYKIEVKPPGKEQIREMFVMYLPEQVYKFEEFYKHVNNERRSSESKITIAVLQSFLFKYRKCANILQKMHDFEELVASYTHEKYDKKNYI